MTDHHTDAAVAAFDSLFGRPVPAPRTPGQDWFADIFLRPRCAACGYRSKTSKAGPKAKGLCVWCVARFMELEEQGALR